MSKHIQARTSTEAFWTLDPFAVVKPGDPWFADLEKMLPREHYGVAHKLKRHLGKSAARPEFVHLTLIGHAGMGKTTLARNAIASLSGDGITPVYIDALQALDQADFTFADAMLVAAEAVIGHLAARGAIPHATSLGLSADGFVAETCSGPTTAAFRLRALDENPGARSRDGLRHGLLVERGLEVGKAHLEVLRQWFAEELVTESHRTQLLGSVEGAAEGEVSVPLVAKIAAKVTAALKSDHEYRREIRKRAERDPRELIRRVNGLLDAVHAAIQPHQLCVVFDNLEKTKLELVDRALLQRAEEFRQLRCNALLFCNPASEYSPVGVQVSKAFICLTVPALPVRLPGDTPSTVRSEAAAAIEWMLGQRVVLEAVFDNPKACVEALAHWSGGHLRDLLQIARRAVENVEPGKVSLDDIEHAARWLGASLTSSLRPGDLPRAVELHRTHRVLDTEQDRRMLKNSCVLQYDGTQWWDVHPAVRADALFLEAQREAERGADGNG